MKKQTIVMQIENEQSGKVTLSVSDYIGKATLHSVCQLCKDKHKGEIKVELSAPYKSRTTGKPSPVSTTQVNTVEMSYLIDTAQEVCAFLGIGQEKNEVDIF